MFEFDTREITRVVNALEEFKRLIPEIAATEAIRQIRELAAQGKAPNGSNWKPYTKIYAAKRAAKGLSTSPVNKRVTGAFLLSIQNRNMVIGPSPEQTPKAEGLEKKRKSFGVAPGLEKSVGQQLEKKLAELL